MFPFKRFLLSCRDHTWNDHFSLTDLQTLHKGGKDGEVPDPSFNALSIWLCWLPLSLLIKKSKHYILCLRRLHLLFIGTKHSGPILFSPSTMVTLPMRGNQSWESFTSPNISANCSLMSPNISLSFITLFHLSPQYTGSCGGSTSSLQILVILLQHCANCAVFFLFQ